jgi:Rrf2 family protein
VKLTLRTEYALLALTHLARKYGGGVASVSEIAEAHQIPLRFLQQILQTLKGARLVTSTKGRDGGYVLSRPPAAVTLAEVVRLFDGPLAPTDSVSVYFYHSTPVEKNPGLVKVFRDIRDYVAQRLESTTLADLL